MFSASSSHIQGAQFNIEGIVKHKNDLASVSAWVEELREMRYNPVVVFKTQGEQVHGPLSENDFFCVP